MDCIQIQGGCPLRGEVRIQGSKNAVLPILAACVLVPGVTVLKNCPDISDVACMCQLLRHVGARVDKQRDALIVDASAITSCHLPAEYVTRMRSSVILAGAMLGRCREIHLYYPGGCVIGDRPIDMHISALEQMGVQFTEEDGGLRARAVSLCGTKIDLPFPSVGATENVLLAAVLARGVTKIRGCATEPEIVALCRFLQGAGARIGGVGTDCLTVEGVPRLSESCCLVEADRIVAGTYLLGVLSAGGDVFLRSALPGQLESVLQVARRMGAQISACRDGIRVERKGLLASPAEIRTAVYPGFPTDLQSPMLVALSQAQGACKLTETIFNGRLRMVGELNRMGAGIRVTGDSAYVCGPQKLIGRRVSARELRGGAALVLAGLCAQGSTEVSNRQFIDRGYEDIVRDLRDLGANIGVKT